MVPIDFPVADSFFTFSVEAELTLVCLNWSSVDPVVFYNIFALRHVHPMG